MSPGEHTITRILTLRPNRHIAAPFSALLLGASAFRSLYTVQFSLLVLTLWARADSRWSAFLVGSFYFVGVTLELPQVILGYHDVDCFRAITAIVFYWPLAASIFGSPFALFWSQRGRRSIQAPLLLFSLFIPPLGIFGVGHPVISAGLLFPGTGLVGVILLLLLSSLYVTRHFWIIILLTMVLSLRYGFVSPPSDSSIYALDTSFEVSSRRTAQSLMTDWKRPFALFSRVSNISSDVEIIVFPEEIAGTFTDEVLRRWSDIAQGLPNKSLIVGGDRINHTHSSNILMAFEGTERTLVYTQRQPVPFTMWQPWNKASYPLSPIAPSATIVRGKRIGFLLCYELLTPWTVIQTATQWPDTIIGATNISYARGTKLYELMELHRELWQSLFGIPVIIANNR